MVSAVFSGLFVYIIIRRVRLNKKKHNSISAMENLAKWDDNWNYENIKKDIEETFYAVQNAWMERNQELAKEYVSDQLYNEHKLQTDAMKMQKEKNILEGMVLLEASPIGLQDLEGTNDDYIWVYIKAKSKDHTVNEETDAIVKGDESAVIYFGEYWKFINKGNRWVLDTIKQIGDIESLDFFEVKAPNMNV